MSIEVPDEDPWASATFEGVELEQLRRWATWSFEKKIEWLEEGYKLTKTLQDARLKMGGPATMRGNGQIENLR